MSDRRSLFSRFWPPSASRRTSTTQTAAAPPPPPPPQTKTPARQSTTKTSSPPAPATPRRTEPRKASPEPSTTPSPNSKDEPKTSSPSLATTRSPSSSKPASPSRFSAQSRSPPQPSSSSHAAPQARSTPPSPSRMTSQTPSTPKQTSKPPSPSRVTSRSPKQGPSSSPKGKQPASPSKDSTQPTEKISTSYEAPISASKQIDPKPAGSQQEAEVKEEVKPDSANVVNAQTQEGESFKHDGVEAKPSQLSELGNTAPPAQGPETRATSKSLDSSTANGGEHEPHVKLDAKPEEIKDVKEVVQATNTEANEETKKEVDDSVAPESVSQAQIVEKAEITNEAQQIHSEKQDTKEISASPLKKSKSSGAHGKSALPNGEHVPLHKNIRAELSKFGNQLALGDHKMANSDRPVSVITLAGENRGASMHMESDSLKREGSIHIHRGYKINPDESPEASTDGEETSEGKKSEDKRSSMDDQMTEAYVNNNAQAINNSIVFNSSIVEGNPGVHVVVSHLQKEPIRSKDETSFPETRKAEVNMSRAEKLTYRPTMRRRCLRGLLLETSDSDPENPEKPRHHGCRVRCQKEDRENNADVL